MAGMDMRTGDNRKATPPVAHANAPSTSTPNNSNMSPFAGGSPTPKSVAFELLFSDTSKYRARLPMRVQIFPHDTTDSIITTVKNFYGLYAGPGGAKGVSFEDVQGNILIARYENLYNNMVVYVRVNEEPAQSTEGFGNTSHSSGLPAMQNAQSGDPHNMPPPQPTQALSYGQPLSRPNSRTSRKRSTSPNVRGRRSASASANPPVLKKSRSRTGFKSRGSSAHGSFADYSDGVNGYSSGDGAAGSVSSKTKSEHIGNTEISLDNIVEGGRRKRAKFESSVRLPDTTLTITINLNRNCPCLLPHKCQRLHRIPRFRQLGEWNSGRPFPSLILPNIHSPTHNHFIHHKISAMDLDNLACILRQPMEDVEPVGILQEQTLLVLHLGLGYSQLQTQQLAVACRKRIKMWPYS